MRHSSRLKSQVGGVMVIAALAFVVASADDNWPQFRGAQAGVAADDPALPDTWGPAKNIIWKIDVPGRSWSSPVVWGDHVFVTTAINTVDAEPLLAISAYVSRSNGGTANAPASAPGSSRSSPSARACSRWNTRFRSAGSAVCRADSGSARWRSAPLSGVGVARAPSDDAHEGLRVAALSGWSRKPSPAATQRHSDRFLLELQQVFSPGAPG